MWAKKRHSLDTGRQRGETVMSECDRHLSGLEGGPSDVVRLKSDSPRPAEETLIIIEVDKTAVAGSIPRFAIEYAADVLLRLAKHGG